MIQNKEIRYFIIDGGKGGGNNEISQWLQENAVLIDSSEYGSWTQMNTNMNRMGNSQLYDLKDAVK